MGPKTYNFLLKHVQLIVIISMLSQFGSAQKSELLTAETLMEQQQFQRALEIYKSMPKSSNTSILLNIARCYIETNQVSKAHEILSTLPKKNTLDTDVLLTQAFLFQTQAKYKEAITIYKAILKKTKSKHPRLSDIRDQIKRNRQAMKVQALPEIAFVENLGDAVNTFHDDFGSVPSPTLDNRFYFSSNRFSNQAQQQTNSTNSTNDMYLAQAENGLLIDIRKIDDTLNTSGEECVLDFSPSGSQLLYYQKINETSPAQIRLKQFDLNQTDQTEPIQFNSKIKAHKGDNYVHIHSDTSYIYSSRRIEGHGGYDIYILKYKDGHWHEPVNVGNQINTSANEICPFLTVDGRQLFFSSNRKESVGGYDIFYSEYEDEHQAWGPAQNIGFPINSIKNDLYFRLQSNGHSASFSSDRIGTLGGLDLYAAYLKNNNTHQLESDGVIPFLRDHEKRNLLFSSLKDKSDSTTFDKLVNTTPYESFQLKPLFFNPKDKLVYGMQKDYAQQLVQFLIAHPSYIIDIHSHSSDEGTATFELYSSIRRTENLVKFLRDNDIAEDRIITKGFGNYFPLNSSFVTNRINAKEQMEKRIQVNLTSMDPSVNSVEFIETETTKRIKNLKYKNYLESIKGLSYSIQIAETKLLYDNNEINSLLEAKIEKINDLFVYSIGSYKTLKQTQDALAAIDPGYFQQLNIVAYINGIRLNPLTRNQYLDLYPDLNNYTTYLDSK